MLGGKNSVQGRLLLNYYGENIFIMEYNLLALRQCLHLSQIIYVIFIVTSSKFP